MTATPTVKTLLVLQTTQNAQLLVAMKGQAEQATGLIAAQKATAEAIVGLAKATDSLCVIVQAMRDEDGVILLETSPPPAPPAAPVQAPPGAAKANA